MCVTGTTQCKHFRMNAASTSIHFVIRAASIGSVGGGKLADDPTRRRRGRQWRRLGPLRLLALEAARLISLVALPDGQVGRVERQARQGVGARRDARREAATCQVDGLAPPRMGRASPASSRPREGVRACSSRTGAAVANDDTAPRRDGAEDRARVLQAGIVRSYFIVASLRRPSPLPAWCFTAGVRAGATGHRDDFEHVLIAVRVSRRGCASSTARGARRRGSASSGTPAFPTEIAASCGGHSVSRIVVVQAREPCGVWRRVLAVLQEVAAQNRRRARRVSGCLDARAKPNSGFFSSWFRPWDRRRMSNRRPGPFARLPFACQTSAVRLVGVLPTLTQPCEALAKMSSRCGPSERRAPRYRDRDAFSNVLAAPRRSAVSFYATLLVGSSGVKFLDKSPKRGVAFRGRRGHPPVASPQCGGRVLSL